MMKTKFPEFETDEFHKINKELQDSKKKLYLELMNEDLEYYLIKKLISMQEEKAERLKYVDPKWVTRAEFFKAVDKDIRAVLNKLFHEKKIRVHKTIHSAQNDYIEYLNKE